MAILWLTYILQSFLHLSVWSILLYINGDVGVFRKFIYMMLVDIHLCIADKRHPHIFPIRRQRYKESVIYASRDKKKWCCPPRNSTCIVIRSISFLESRFLVWVLNTVFFWLRKRSSLLFYAIAPNNNSINWRNLNFFTRLRQIIIYFFNLEAAFMILFSFFSKGALLLLLKNVIWVKLINNYDDILVSTFSVGLHTFALY